MTSPERISEAEAALRLGVNKQTLARWRKARKGPTYYRPGHVVQYDAADVEAFRLKHRHDPAEPEAELPEDVA